MSSPVSSDVLTRLAEGLVVSCQAPPDDPLSGPRVMALMAQAVVRAGACGIRAEGLDDLAAVVGAVDVPVIGLVKRGDPGGVYITPTLADVRGVLDAGAAVVAADGTSRPRPDGSSLAEAAVLVHERGRLLMADVDGVDAARAAVDAGADLVGTTLSGYTPTTRTDGRTGPDLALVERLAAELPVPVVAEGRISTPALAAEARTRGASVVVVGTAITRPMLTAERFVQALRDVGARHG